MQPSIRRLIAALALALACLGPPASAGAEWTVDDILLAESAGDFDVSPDGERIVWSHTTREGKEGKSISNLVLRTLAEDEAIRLTRGEERHTRPRFSPDGRLIAFLSDRELPGGEKKKEGELAPTQLWLIRPSGGEAWPLTRLVRGVRDFDWASDERLIFAAQESPSQVELARKKADDTSQVVEDVEQEPPVRLFALAVAEAKDKPAEPERLTDNEDWLQGFVLSPDGRRAVTVHQQSLSYQFDGKVLPATFLYDLETGERQRLLEGARIVPSSVAWQRDGSGFFVSAPYSSHPIYQTATVERLYRHDLASGETAEVDLGWERGLGRSSLGVTAGGFVALLADGVHLRLARYDAGGDGWQRTDLAGEHLPNVFRFELGEDGETLVYRTSTPARAPQWHAARLEGGQLVPLAQLTELNPSFADKPAHRTEIVRFTGARGDEVEGILYYPFGYEEGKRYPLILTIHGGPAGTDYEAWSESWAYPRALLAQKGAFQLRVNYHGSAGYGLEWVESIGGGNYYELEIPDLEAGVDAMIERGLADPDKLATFGWSNGGILSAELITRSGRYKAASVGAADVEWISDWGNVDFGATFDNYYFGASPWEDPQLYLDKSPFFRLDRVTTPTIVFTGTEDRNVPPSQSWSLFRALQQFDNTDVRLVLFPGEPHGLRKLAHQRRKVEEDLAWLDEHLFGRADGRNPAVQEGSPLEHALTLAEAARSRGRYGVERRGVLVPEVVEHGGIAVARFEITRAQLEEYEKTRRRRSAERGPATPVAEPNHPATAVGYEEARAYAAWLSKLTGERYRLPNAEEAGKLYANAGGNTLDRWAGYAPNPEDAERLHEAARSLPGEGPLLEPVGSFPGKGKGAAAVFDLDGNAAEWTTDEAGGGALRGGSADRPAKGADEVEPGPAYRGFRVVRDQD